MGARSKLADHLRRLIEADPGRVVAVHYDSKGRLRSVQLAPYVEAPLPAPRSPYQGPSVDIAAPGPPRPRRPDSLDPLDDGDDDRFASSGMRPDRRRG